MSIALHNSDYSSRASWRSQKRQLAGPLAFSVLLHLVVLSQIDWDGMHARINEQHRLTVNLVPALLSEELSWQVKADRKQETRQFASQDDGIKVLDANESDYRLDLNRIRNQVREYARQEITTSGHGLPLNGDYYGTYTGDDSGVFSFHLDHAGQVSGSGESSATGIVFFISGNIAPDGVIHMIARRDDAKANLSGQLNTRSGRISGSWHVSGIAEGLFSGQHE